MTILYTDPQGHEHRLRVAHTTPIPPNFIAGIEEGTGAFMMVAGTGQHNCKVMNEKSQDEHNH